MITKNKMEICRQGSFMTLTLMFVVKVLVGGCWLLHSIVCVNKPSFRHEHGITHDFYDVKIMSLITKSFYVF